MTDARTASPTDRHGTPSPSWGRSSVASVWCSTSIRDVRVEERPAEQHLELRPGLALLRLEAEQFLSVPVHHHPIVEEGHEVDAADAVRREGGCGRGFGLRKHGVPIERGEVSRTR